jgi:beta-glucosidase
MPKVKLVPGLWGSLTPPQPLSDEQIEAKARELLQQLSLDEKIHQMSGDTPTLSGMIEMLRAYGLHPMPAGENLRLGVPGVRFCDGPRGVTLYHSTCFPVSMARGASWDIDLEERIGDAIGVEARSQGANYFGGVCINLLRHPAWGRAQETYGEDPYHLGELGAALVRGVQRHVMACVKHYAANSIENARLKVDVRLSERTLREIYLPHFKRCVDEGAASIMSAYNKVNGEFCSENAHLLRDILKHEWAFSGFVLSDFVFAVHDGGAALRGGLDIEMPFTQHYGKKLKKLVESGEVSASLIDDAVLRILRQKIRFAQIGEPDRYGLQSVVSAEHRALAREAAQKSLVLLKNDRAGESRMLPIDRARVQRLALIGELAEVANIGDHGSSRVRPPYVVTPRQGVQAAVTDRCELIFEPGKQPSAAAAAARRAAVAIVVVGYRASDEGERLPQSRRGGDRAALTLKPRDEALIQAVAAAQPRTVVVLIGGSAIITEAWRERVPAIVMAWYPGMEGGHALADVLFGAVNPGGKLPCVFPQAETQLPFFDRHADAIEYGYYHGYRLLDRAGHEPAFAFGHGLSYTTFEYRNLRIDRDTIPRDGAVQVSVDITNTGDRAGDEVAQLYVGYEGTRVDRAVKDLKGFTRLHLQAGETKTAVFTLRADQVAYYAETQRGWVVEPIGYTVLVGPSSRAGDLLTSHFRVD